MTRTRPPAQGGTAPDEPQTDGEYLFVWNDTVRGKKLLLGIVLGVAGAMIGLYGGKWLVGLFVADPALVKVWSLVTGLIGTVIGAVIVGFLVPPARIVSDHASDTSRVDETIDEMAADPQGLGTLAQASARSRHELAEAGLTAAFEAGQARAAGTPGDSGAPGTAGTKPGGAA
jgi:uncharacterized membrane protein YeaQ/YmgE (transglycosylase-associated protein family)